MKSSCVSVLIVLQGALIALGGGGVGCVMESGGERLDEEPEVPVRPGDRDEFDGFDRFDPGEDQGGGASEADLGTADLSSPDAASSDMGRDLKPEPELDLGPGVPGALFLSGALDAPLEVSAELVVLWYVRRGGAPYFYKYGRGRAIASGWWSVELPAAGPPPDMALNEDGFGAAMILMVDSSAQQVESGRLSVEAFDALEARALGVTRAHALVYFKGEPSGERAWADDFEADRYACAEALAPNRPGLKPAPCEEVRLELGELTWVRF